jgi:benzoyl-CoA reductase/2-hydroxyglutaryl-CoA dehydratase subunit BcrC/BadD/HgdB
MAMDQASYVGFTCAYTPLALIDAAGYAPYRILPMGDAPDRAGQVLHDNLCPHVKRVLDRALNNDLPELAGVVLLNSCDAMRRLADAWPKVRPNDRMIFIDLPFTSNDAAVSYFSAELSRLAKTLFSWSGRVFSQEALAEGVAQYNRMATLFDALRQRVREGTIHGGAARVQDLNNTAVTRPFSETFGIINDIPAETVSQDSALEGVPVFVFGNVLPDPEAFGLFETCGVRIVQEDFCTGSRVFSPLDVAGSGDILPQLAKALLNRPRCARTVHPTRPGILAEEVLARAVACNARGVIACTAKFCDPYIARMPSVRDALRKAGLPLLHIEGDCSMRSFGQQRTRIEAFAEMLGG